jgi:hypothetical protein
MGTTELRVFGGPDKAELLRSLANPGREVRVQFHASDGAFDAAIDRMEPSGTEGTELMVEGHIHSGIYDGLCFAGTYDLGNKKGVFTIHIPPEAAPAL